VKPTVTLKFDLSSPKVEAFVSSQKCTDVESRWKYVQYFSRYCVNNVRHAQTHRQKTYCFLPHYVWRRHKSNVIFVAVTETNEVVEKTSFTASISTVHGHSLTSLFNARLMNCCQTAWHVLIRAARCDNEPLCFAAVSFFLSFSSARDLRDLSADRRETATYRKWVQW